MGKDNIFANLYLWRVKGTIVKLDFKDARVRRIKYDGRNL